MRTIMDMPSTGEQTMGTAQSVSVSLGRQPLWRVGINALTTQLHHIRDTVTVVCEESGVEDIHQMRVATRRLRTMARLLEATPVFRREPITRMRGRLKPLATDLGAVRDLDIILEHLDEYIPGSDNASQAPSSPLRDELLHRREKALSHLRRTLQQPSMQWLLRHPNKTVKRMVSRTRNARQTLVRHVAGSALWGRYEAVLSFEGAMAGDAATEQFHALRITCKQLRYALELFTVDTDSCALSLISTLKDVQTHLGDLQDCVFAVALLTRLRHNYPHDALLEGFRAAQEIRQDALRHDFAPLWERISGEKYRQNLAALIVAL
jgi:CHAD domain-containing protein